MSQEATVTDYILKRLLTGEPQESFFSGWLAHSWEAGRMNVQEPETAGFCETESVGFWDVGCPLLTP